LILVKFGYGDEINFFYENGYGDEMNFFYENGYGIENLVFVLPQLSPLLAIIVVSPETRNMWQQKTNYKKKIEKNILNKYKKSHIDT